MSGLRGHAAVRSCWFLCFALFVRGGVSLACCDRLAADRDGYRSLAVNLVDEGVLGSGTVPSAYRPPLYPLLLAACVAGPWPTDAAIALVHVVLGVATAWSTVALGRRWGLDRFAYLAGTLVACDPILVNQSTLVMTETLATFFATAGLAFISATSDATGRRRLWLAALTGACLAIAALCRPTFLGSLFCLALGIVWLWRGWRDDLPTLAAMCLAASLTLLPWAVRNMIDLGTPIVTTTHGGYTLLLGNNRGYYEFLRRSHTRALWDASELDASLRARRTDDEVANDRREYEEAWQTIREQPVLFLYAAACRAGALWGLLPHQVTDDETSLARWGRYATAAWYTVVFALALTALVGSRGARATGITVRITRPPWLWPTLLAASFTAVHLLYWTDMRMRAPLIPAISLLAAAGAKRLAAWAGRL